LTGLPNRMLFREHLDVALRRAARAGASVAVCFVDRAGFKLVNDRFGHAVGDDLLIEVAARLGNVVRDQDVVARQGGDEFLILLADLATGVAGGRSPVAGALTRATTTRAALQ